MQKLLSTRTILDCSDILPGVFGACCLDPLNYAELGSRGL